MAEAREYLTSAGESGNLNISEEVIAVVAANAASEVDGVSSLCGGQKVDHKYGGAAARRNLGHSVTIDIADSKLIVNVSLFAKAGTAIAELGRNVQKSVFSAIESACGVSPTAVNVRVAGIR